MVPEVTPNSRARADWLCSTKYLCLILLTCTVVSFAFQQRSPLAPGLWRPFAMQSLQLSPLVPSHRWSGLTHSFTSHLCSTHSPSGISPLCSSQLYLWAKYCTWLTLRCPYPLGVFPAFHNQHESVLFTFSRNLSFCVMHIIIHNTPSNSSSLFTNG